MWINDHKLFELIEKWERADTVSNPDARHHGYRHAADDLRALIDEEQAPMPAPSEGSVRCMIYTKGPR